MNPLNVGSVAGGVSGLLVRSLSAQPVLAGVLVGGVLVAGGVIVAAVAWRIANSESVEFSSDGARWKAEGMRGC